MQQTEQKLRRGDWIRLQRKANKMVLEGFVQEVASDGSKIQLGKASYSSDGAWHLLAEIDILKRQSH